jgi:hypothetical protein
MADLISAVPALREALVALFRTHQAHPESVKKGKLQPAKIQGGVVGSGFCVVANQYVVTAHHVLNDGKPRDPQDRFYAFVVSGNADTAYHFPVVGFPCSLPDLDFAILELGPCAMAGITLPAIPVSLAPRPDGTHVVTLGFPSPVSAGFSLDQHGNYAGGQFFLKSHANTGIVSAQYSLGGIRVYELNVGWHHGESGGPIATVEDPPRVFSLMQHYRKVQAPHGIVMGPRRGIDLVGVANELTAIGATIR